MEKENVLLSIKPQFAFAIIEGKKTVELRRKFPTQGVIGKHAVIYASSPLKKIIGYALIENVSFLPVHEIWAKYSEASGTHKKFFDLYYKNLVHGFVVHLKSPVSLLNPISLDELRKNYGVSPPQSYRYIADGLLYDIIG